MLGVRWCLHRMHALPCGCTAANLRPHATKLKTRHVTPPSPPQGNSTDKLTTSVTFPLRDLSLHQFASPECPARPGELRYELFAVSNHYGNLSGALRCAVVMLWPRCARHALSDMHRFAALGLFASAAASSLVAEVAPLQTGSPPG